MRKRLLRSVVVFLGVLIGGCVAAQCDTIASICTKHMSKNFISDGQLYRALLTDDEVAEFHATFYGGSTYRIAACTGAADGNLLFTIFDQDRNELFSNSEYDNSPYWDFEIASTINIVVEAQLNLNRQESGCAVLLIGFRH